MVSFVKQRDTIAKGCERPSDCRTTDWVQRDKDAEKGEGISCFTSGCTGEKSMLKANEREGVCIRDTLGCLRTWRKRDLSKRDLGFLEEKMEKCLHIEKKLNKELEESCRWAGRLYKLKRWIKNIWRICNTNEREKNIKPKNQKRLMRTIEKIAESSWNLKKINLRGRNEKSRNVRSISASCSEEYNRPGSTITSQN